jgi:hypothetical protein
MGTMWVRGTRPFRTIGSSWVNASSSRASAVHDLAQPAVTFKNLDRRPLFAGDTSYPSATPVGIPGGPFRVIDALLAVIFFDPFLIVLIPAAVPLPNLLRIGSTVSARLGGVDLRILGTVTLVASEFLVPILLIVRPGFSTQHVTIDGPMARPSESSQ